METITFDGFDGDDLVVRKINVWRDWSDRTQGSVASVKHGSRGVLLEHSGNACRVRVKSGTRRVVDGWVTFWFIRELKQEWQNERRSQAIGHGA